EPQFPQRQFLFLWRNWELANLDRMALVLRTKPEILRGLGRSMGLPPKPELSSEQLRRIYITVIRQNWHVLPLEQITELLGWTPEKLAFTLKEDDFLDVKLGPKPACDPVVYSEPTAEDKRRLAEIRKLVESAMGKTLAQPGEPAFTFVSRLSQLEPPVRSVTARPGSGQLDLTHYRLESTADVPPALAETLRRHMRSLRASEGGTARLRLRLDSSLEPATFVFDPQSDGAELAAGSADALFQSVRWFQDATDFAGGPFLPAQRVERKVALDPRYLYSFFALYGDPLLETDIDPFPDGYLDKLGRVGLNGVWMQCVLNNMAPSKSFPEFGRGSEQRLANLNRLVERAARQGLKIYLYLNEPRSMPAAFFESHPEIRGAESRGVYAMCTTPALVRDWISDSLAHIFQQVPGLGGVFSITMSENLTNCFSHFHPESCPRCSQRKSWEVVGEVLEAFRSGVRRSSRDAAVIAWDWGWPEDMCRELIPKLPRDIRLNSVSEWSTPIERGGVKTRVGEYSISVVGPGPRATANWQRAKEAGVRYMAKCQFNNTWEISAVPYIPVPNLIAEHCSRLVRSGISGLMAGWTLGGYPSPNLEVAKEFYLSPAGSPEEVLRRVAERRYGKDARDLVLHAWTEFSEAFRLYPYSVAIYTIPTQHGPANLLRARPTGVRNSMILFPQDDYKRWAGQYPPEVAQREFARMASRWQAALPDFQKAMRTAAAQGKPGALEDAAIAETCWIHFQSTANQIEFYILRDGPQSAQARGRMRELARAEIDLARRLYPLVRQHSVIAYEASNHYYYRPTDLLEKILNCQYLLDHDLAG
ncbi:MAG TPA: hypothetical protein VG672_04835, partial [Bryobacteraceae bacterium]|nr:hypothetical protein [Bryobacteraceae bacterium]